jgi:hypothetical protein
MDTGTPGGGLPVGNKDGLAAAARGRLADRVEDNLARLLEETKQMLAERRREVLCLAHALETHKTLSGDDVSAVLDGEVGPLVDGRPYRDDALYQEIEAYHRAAVIAHMNHTSIAIALPAVSTREPVAVGAAVTQTDAPEWVWARPLPGGNGSGPNLGESAPVPPPSIIPQSPPVPPQTPTDRPFGSTGTSIFPPAPPADEPRPE